MALTIKNLRRRIAKMEDILSKAACGDLEEQLDVDTVDSGELTALGTGINILIADVGSEVRQSKQRAIELEEKLKLIEQQRKAIEELSTLIIKIWEQVLVLPLIGTLDTRRSQRLTEALLADIAATQTKVTILDITGVPTVDSAVANHLLKTISAVQLLGCRVRHHGYPSRSGPNYRASCGRSFIQGWKRFPMRINYTPNVTTYTPDLSLS